MFLIRVVGLANYHFRCTMLQTYILSILLFVFIYSFPQPQIHETLPHNIHCPGPESLAFVGAAGSSLHLHRTLLVLCNEGLDVTMTSIPWKLSRVVYEGKLVTYTQCVFFGLMSIYHNSLQEMVSSGTAKWMPSFQRTRIACVA